VLGGALVTLVFCTSGSAQVIARSGGEAFLGRNGDILFVSVRVRSGHERLYLMRADGTHQRPITRAPGNVAAPTWSPGGKRIAYRTAETVHGPCPQLYVMRADGTRARRLTHDGGATAILPGRLMGGASPSNERGPVALRSGR
jgi:Tol biopolymer transport system component